MARWAHCSRHLTVSSIVAIFSPRFVCGEVGVVVVVVVVYALLLLLLLLHGAFCRRL